jgi:hypothetical protein
VGRVATVCIYLYLYIGGGGEGGTVGTVWMWGWWVGWETTNFPRTLKNKNLLNVLRASGGYPAPSGSRCD